METLVRERTPDTIEAIQPNYIQNASLRELTRHEDAEFLLAQRLRYEVETTDWDEDWKQKAYYAIELATKCHSNVMRDDKTYTTHVLRVATRIISSKHFNDRSDPRTVIAAILHDSVEDSAHALLGEPQLDEDDMSEPNLQALREQRMRALDFIRNEFDDETANTVAALSNNIYDRTGMPESSRQSYYRAKVVSVLDQNNGASLIKLSDFIDNCLGIEYNGSVKLRLKLANKYKPLLPHMMRFVMNHSNLDESVRQRLIDELIYANELCNIVISSEGRQNNLGSIALVASGASSPLMRAS